MSETSHEWYYLKSTMLNEVEAGPVSEAEMKELAHSGTVKLTTALMSPTRTKGHWTKLQTIKGFAKLWQDGNDERQAAKTDAKRLRVAERDVKRLAAAKSKAAKVEDKNALIMPQPLPPRTVIQAQPMPMVDYQQPAPAVSQPSMTHVTQQIIIGGGHQVARKSMALAFLLTLLFGPIGMIYSTVGGAFVMLIVGLFIIPTIGLVTAGLGFILFVPYWIVCLVWAVLAC